MDTSLFVTQRKKLIMIGLFLLAVVAVVGREEDPGMLQQIAAEAEGAPVSAGPAQQQSAAPTAATAPQPSRQAQQTPDLDSWYSEAGRQNVPVEPIPENKDWLINDAEPLVSAEPIS